MSGSATAGVFSPTNKQDFGDDPIAVRESDHYRGEYVRGFVDKWDELIDWEARAKSEGRFFIDVLKARGKHTVLDVAAGTGFHSIQLLKAGFDVTSADGSAEMLARAFDNGRRQGIVLKTVHADWRWLNKDVKGKYDAIICLGNSFTHLFDENDRRRALAEFYAALKHDGILIIDQRNYDDILDKGFASKHKYYYCGDKVTAEPEYVDDSLTRFKYDFPDGSQYHLNMFPLRKNYLRKLLRDVGFQKIHSYGDFQEEGEETDPDFFVHVAEKTYEPSSKARADGVDTARDYYDSEDADNFYATIWGGEDIHIGLYDTTRDIRAASRLTVDRIASKMGDLGGKRVLDIGSGFGGAARVLAKEHGARVTCLNLSTVENARNRAMNKDAGLAGMIDVVDGSFDDLPFGADNFDAVWSQDAILHAPDRKAVLDEVERVLKPGGQFIFTDPMQADHLTDASALQPIYDRIHLSNLASFGFYRRELAARGFEEIGIEDLTQQLRNHYARVREDLLARRKDLKSSDAFVERMAAGLQHWVDGADKGLLAWGIMHFRKR